MRTTAVRGRAWRCVCRGRLCGRAVCQLRYEPIRYRLPHSNRRNGWPARRAAPSLKPIGEGRSCERERTPADLPALRAWCAPGSAPWAARRLE